MRYMASIRRRGKSWLAEVCKKGDRDSKTFRTKAEAAAWALQREAELTGKKLPDKSLKEALDRYAREVATTRPGERWEVLRCGSMARLSIAMKRIGELDASHLAEWRDERLRSVSAATVRLPALRVRCGPPRVALDAHQPSRRRQAPAAAAQPETPRVR
jgi:hypothetical protein